MSQPIAFDSSSNLSNIMTAMTPGLANDAERFQALMSKAETQDSMSSQDMLQLQQAMALMQSRIETISNLIKFQKDVSSNILQKMG